MELTPAERQRIYEEEKVRLEMQEKLRKEAQEKAPVATPSVGFVSQKNDTHILKVIAIVTILALGIIMLWWVTIPAVIIWYVFKKSSLAPETRKKVSLATVILFSVLGAFSVYSHRAPTLTLTEPSDNTSVQSGSILVKGSVTPDSTVVTMNGRSVAINEGGSFEYKADLMTEKNELVFTAINYGKQAVSTLRVERVFTAEEQAAREEQRRLAEEERMKKEAARKAAEEEEKRLKEEQAKKDAAAQKAWEQSKAGKLCTKNPAWKKEECENVANRKYWIGMTYDMLVAAFGKPNHANPSNYGGVTHWQWCYNSITPSCFYDSDGDSRIDAYN